MLPKLIGKFAHIRRASEEAVRLLLAHCAEANERFVEELWRRVPIRVEDGFYKLRQLCGVAERVAHALIAFGERWQGGESFDFSGKHGNEQERAWIARSCAR